MPNKIITIAPADIRVTDFSLRKVDKESEGYIGLVNSIRERGFISSVTVCESVDKVTGAKVYELVDGLHRLSAAVEAGVDKITAVVADLDETGILETQILANVHRIETRPADYSKQLRKIIMLSPTMTVGELAKKLAKTPLWVKERLQIASIENETINDAINAGQIPVHNAVQLAKLPPEEQAEWILKAMEMPVAEFTKEVTDRVKQLKEHARKGLDSPEDTFQGHPVLRKLGIMKEVRENPALVENIINKSGAKSAVDGAKALIDWVFQLDAETLKAREADFNAKKAARDEARKAATAKRLEKANAKAQADAAKAEEAKAKLEAALAEVDA